MNWAAAGMVFGLLWGGIIAALVVLGLLMWVKGRYGRNAFLVGVILLITGAVALFAGLNV